MQTANMLNGRPRYVVTAAGRAAMAEATRCACRIVLVGFWAVCPDCGTCYANLRESSPALVGAGVNNGKKV